MATKKINTVLEGWGAWLFTIIGLGLMVFGFWNIVQNDQQESKTRQLISDTRAGTAVISSYANVVALGNDQWKALDSTMQQVSSAYELLGKGGNVEDTENTQIFLNPLEGSAHLGWLQAGQSLSDLESSVKIMQEDQGIVEKGLHSEKNWFELLKNVAASVEFVQNQTFSNQEPWLSMITQQKKSLESFPRDASLLSSNDIATISQNASTISDFLKTTDSTTQNKTESLQKSWQNLADAGQMIGAKQQALIRLQQMQPKILASSIAFQKDLADLSGRLNESVLWIRWMWVGVGLLLVLISISLMLYFSQIWINQAAKGKTQVRRYEKLESASHDLVRQVNGLFDGDALKINGRIDLSEDRNSILAPVVEALNKTLEVISKIMNQTEQKLGDIRIANKEADSHIEPLLGYSQKNKELMQNLESKVFKVQEDVALVQSGWSDLQLKTHTAYDKGREGREIVQASQATTDGVRQALQDTAKRIKRMGESTQNIIQSTSIIRNLTREMHVLSTNAAIEVAAVGEKGRKFGVVAQEIQRLSKNTNQIISEIEGWVKKVQEDAQGAIFSMETSTGGVARSSHHNEQASDILKEFQFVLDNTDELSQSISQMLSGLIMETQSWQHQLQEDNLKSDEVHHHILSTSANLEKSQQALTQIKRATSHLSVQS